MFDSRWSSAGTGSPVDVSNALVGRDPVNVRPTQTISCPGLIRCDMERTLACSDQYESSTLWSCGSNVRDTVGGFVCGAKMIRAGDCVKENDDDVSRQLKTN